MSTTTLLAGVLLALAPAPQGVDLPALVAELEQRGDDAEAEQINRVADFKTRPAMEALLKFYDQVGTTYVRREVVRALARFDGVAEAEEPALEKITNVATTSTVAELREAAVKALGQCEHLGKHFLTTIIDSRANNEVRELALKLHATRATEGDAKLYRKIWKFNEERRKSTAKDEPPPEVETVREAAFNGLAKFLKDAELVDAIKNELNPKIRRAALSELEQRKSPMLQEMATRQFERVDVLGTERAQAAEILAAMQGPKMVSEFLKLAKKKAVTPEDLRQAMAALLVDMNDPKVNKQLAGLIGRGAPHEKIFALQATVHLDDPKLVAKIRKGLGDKDSAVRRATALALAKRGDKESIPELEKMLAKPREAGDARIAIEALGILRRNERPWVAQLVELTRSDVRDVRNAAVDQLAETKDTSQVPLCIDLLSHEDWTTRLAAIRALENVRDKRAVPALIERLQQEDGRMETLVADALWALTAMPFEKDVAQWQAWWKDKGDQFKVPSRGDLATAAQEREVRRLRQRTVVAQDAEFFGVPIESHRAIFIIDTSGSMVEAVPGRMVGNREAARIEVAKEELQQCLKALDEHALFNIFSFSSGVGRWLESGVATASAKSRAEAIEFVERLGAGGATNLYDTLKMAFEDPDVDTIYVLSDGEPTAGEVTDPHQIREDVKRWNQHRRIVIHTIAVGGSLEVLEWLAKDSGGSYVRFG